MENNLEEGAAEIIVSLKNSIVTVRHGESNQVLFTGKAHKGDWSKIFNYITNVGEDIK
jgi:hypothetical protein